MDDICQNFANGTLKITTRQTWQVQGLVRSYFNYHMSSYYVMLYYTI